MLLDFRKIFQNGLKPINESLLLDFSSDDFGGFTAKQPISVDIKAAVLGDDVQLKIKVNADILSICARCLDDVNVNFTFERTFFIKNGEWLQDNPDGNNLPFSASGTLNIYDLIYSELILEVPNVHLCNDNCLGLCTICGHKKPCNCKDCDTTDERLLPLKQLLTD